MKPKNGKNLSPRSYFQAGLREGLSREFLLLDARRIFVGRSPSDLARYIK
jgi:hypothetical protein